MYTLLGEDRKDVKEWSKIRVLLGKIGKKSLRRRILEFDMKSIEGKHALIKRAKSLINNHTLDEVKVWGQNFVWKNFSNFFNAKL